MPEDALIWLMLALPFIGSVCAASCRSVPVMNAGLLAGASPRRAIVAACSMRISRWQDRSFGKSNGCRRWASICCCGLDACLDFAFLILAGGFLVVLYARYYMSPRKRSPLFLFLLAFMGSMLGSSSPEIWCSCILLGTDQPLFLPADRLLAQNQSARDGARMALIVTVPGALPADRLLLIGKIVGSYDLDVVLASGNVMRSSGLYEPAMILILIGAFTRAPNPFQFWLRTRWRRPTGVRLSPFGNDGEGRHLCDDPAVAGLAGTDLWYFIVSTPG